ncbi:MAG: hypothetical protein HY665_03370 [Chloroflexi bacterium]|nr:hypothetical protein [Chloroflexota bacterium]
MITMKKYLAPALLIALIVSAGCTKPEVKDYDALNNEFTALKKEYDAAKSQLTSQQNTIQGLQSELTSKTGALDQAQKRVSELESRLNRILDTNVVEYYRLSHGGFSYDWTVPITLKTYFYFKDQPRPGESSRYTAMAIDPNAGSVIDILSRNFEDAALTHNLRKTDVVNLVAAFVQSLPHNDKEVTTPADEYPRFPIETLFEQGGDSTDTSILTAALLVKQGYDVVLFVYEQQKHVAVGVNVAGAGGITWEHQGNRYSYLETMGVATTGTGWQLGEAPSQFRDPRPVIIPVRP